MKYSSLSTIGIAVVVLLIFLYAGRYQNSKPNDNQDSQQTQKNQIEWQVKNDEQGSVSITVTPQVFEEESGQWKFNIIFDTHSVELDQDLLEVATLVDDKGNIYKPLAWDGTPLGGHHREGILTFPAIKPVPSYVRLKIEDIGDIPERVFEWS